MHQGRVNSIFFFFFFLSSEESSVFLGFSDILYYPSESFAMILDSVIFPTNLSSELMVYSTLVQIRRIGAGGFMISNLIFHHHTLALAL